MNADRKAWERESILEDVTLHGFAALTKQKYLALAGYMNWCPSANALWLTDWRRMKKNAKVDLEVRAINDQLFLIDPSSVKISGKLSTYS